MSYGALYGLNRRYGSYERIQVLDNILSILTSRQINQIRQYVETLRLDKLIRLLDEFFDSSQQQVRLFPWLAY